jgi:hypothetical protein
VRAFYALLRDLFELEEEQEALITNTALSLLLEAGSAGAAKFLLDELESAAEVQPVTDDQGREWACLLFALPVVVPQGDALERQPTSEAGMADLYAALDSAQALDASARFALVPRLFSAAQVGVWTHSRMAAWTRHLGAQALQGERLAQPPQAPPPDAGQNGSCSPYVDLYFVLGVAVADPRDLSEVFTPVPAEEEEALAQGPGLPPVAPPDPAAQDWEERFCDAFDDTFGAVEGALAVLPPCGLLEDLARGQMLARDVGLASVLKACGPTPPRVSLGLRRHDARNMLVQVDCLGPLSRRAKVAPVIASVPWPIFAHETEAEALEHLMACLQYTQATLVREAGKELPLTASLRVH